MAMRITNNMIISRNLMNQQTNLFNMNKLYEDISSTRSLHRPSDDPIRVTRTLRFSSDIRLNDQYQDNISYAKSWLETTDGSLKEINSILHRARELAVQGANGTMTDEDTQKIKQEIEELESHLITVANQTLTGRRIFSGFRTDKDLLINNPGVADHGEFNFTTTELDELKNQKIEVKIGDQQRLAINITGDKIFKIGAGNKPKIIEVINTLKDELEAGNSANISTSIGEIDDCLKDLLETRGEVGAKVKTIEVIEDRMTDDSMNLKKLLSQTRDTDMAAAYTQFMSYEAIYRASLAVAGRIIQPTLIDFIR